mgnify:CR=1 FL=1
MKKILFVLQHQQQEILIIEIILLKKFMMKLK